VRHSARKSDWNSCKKSAKFESKQGAVRRSSRSANQKAECMLSISMATTEPNPGALTVRASHSPTLLESRSI
jgi:hypothetical protein